MNELALFAGGGGGLLGGLLCGWRTVAAVEIEEYARAVLLQRQADGILPRFPVWDDVRTFDGKPWRGKVDVVTGGFPCQDISVAGKGAGITGERSGLWSEFARIIGEVRPRYVLVENSPMLVGRGLTRVLGDLAEMGYDARWGIIGAHHAGAPHKRDRIWIVGELADADTLGLPRPWAEQLTAGTAGCCEEGETVADTVGDGRNARRNNYAGNVGAKFTADGKHDYANADTLRKSVRTGFCAQRCFEVSREIKLGRGDQRYGAGNSIRTAEPRLGRVAHELADRLDIIGETK